MASTSRGSSILFLFVFWLNQSFEDILGDSQLAFFVAVAAALGFFGSILLHEFGHALAARREGIEVSGIDLFFFGGVMKMSSDTRSPGQEFRVAVAGPLVTLLIVIVTGLGSVALLGWDGFTDSATLEGTAPSDAFELWLSFLVSMNVLLLVFNLIPAFPLDGGRIARAAIWKVTGDRGRATRASAYLGQGFAALLIGYGLYLLRQRERDDERAVGDRAGLPARLLRPRGDRPVGLHRAPRGRHGRRHHGRRAGGDPGRPPRRAGVGGVLPALLRLAVVRGRGAGRPVRRPRAPRRR